MIQAVTGDADNLTKEERLDRRKKDNEMRWTILEKAGYNRKDFICYTGLGPHKKAKCPVYGPRFQLSSTLCYVDRKPHGFHTASECKGKIDRQQTRTGKTRLRTWRVKKM